MEDICSSNLRYIHIYILSKLAHPLTWDINSQLYRTRRYFDDMSNSSHFGIKAKVTLLKPISSLFTISGHEHSKNYTSFIGL